MTNRDLLYRAGNSTQSSVMTYMGKESEKRVDLCICVTDSLCCTAETNTILYVNSNKNLKKVKRKPWCPTTHYKNPRRAHSQSRFRCIPPAPVSCLGSF